MKTRSLLYAGLMTSILVAAPVSAATAGLHPVGLSCLGLSLLAFLGGCEVDPGYPGH